MSDGSSSLVATFSERLACDGKEITVKAGDRVQLAVYGLNALWQNTLEIRRVTENDELVSNPQMAIVEERPSLTYLRPVIEVRERTYVYEVSEDLLAWERLVIGTNYTETITSAGDEEQVRVSLFDVGEAA